MISKKAIKFIAIYITYIAIFKILFHNAKIILYHFYEKLLLLSILKFHAQFFLFLTLNPKLKRSPIEPRTNKLLSSILEVLGNSLAEFTNFLSELRIMFSFEGMRSVFLSSSPSIALIPIKTT